MQYLCYDSAMACTIKMIYIFAVCMTGVRGITFRGSELEQGALQPVDCQLRTLSSELQRQRGDKGLELETNFRED